MTQKSNIFRFLPGDLQEEVLEKIIDSSSLSIERIVSRGHASKPGFWYDQENNEFVLLLQGKAGLRFEGKDDTLILEPGDYVNIRAHEKHRVEWTDPEMETIWLAVHF